MTKKLNNVNNDKIKLIFVWNIKVFYGCFIFLNFLFFIYNLYLFILYFFILDLEQNKFFYKDF